MTALWLTRAIDVAALIFTPGTAKTNPYLEVAERARAERQRIRAELAELDRQAAVIDAREPAPVREWTPRPPRADGLTDDQAAIAEVRQRGLPCGIAQTAGETELGTTRIANASYLLGHAPDLATRVEAGELRLADAAIVARLRDRGHADLLARAEKCLPDLDPRRRRDGNAATAVRWSRAAETMLRINRRSAERHCQHRERDQATKDNTNEQARTRPLQAGLEQILADRLSVTAHLAERTLDPSTADHLVS